MRQEEAMLVVALVATQSMLQNVGDDDVVSTDHKAKAQRLRQGFAKVETEGQWKRCLWKCR